MKASVMANVLSLLLPHLHEASCKHGVQIPFGMSVSFHALKPITAMEFRLGFLWWWFVSYVIFIKTPQLSELLLLISFSLLFKLFSFSPLYLHPFLSSYIFYLPFLPSTITQSEPDIMAALQFSNSRKSFSSSSLPIFFYRCLPKCFLPYLIPS